MQFQADILGVPVERPELVETTTAGAAYLAGIGIGLFRNAEELGAARRIERRFEPRMAQSERDLLVRGADPRCGGRPVAGIRPNRESVPEPRDDQDGRRADLSTGLPAFSHPMIPAGMMKTFRYPSPSALLAATWHAVQRSLAQ